MMMQHDEAQKWIGAALRVAMARGPFSYTDMAVALSLGGSKTSADDLRSKVSAGDLGAAEFIECLAAMRIDVLVIGDDELPLTREVHAKYWRETGLSDEVLENLSYWRRRG